MTSIHSFLILKKLRLLSIFLSILGLGFVAATPSRASDAAILKAAFHADDLTITVAWDTFIAANWAEVAVLDEARDPVVTQLIWPTPGGFTLTDFSEFARDPRAVGAQYTVEIRDAAGGLLAEPLPFRTGYRCDGPDGPCELNVIQGLETSIPTADEALLEALDGARDAQSDNVLRHVLSTRPGLAGDVFSLAKQIRRLDDEHSLGTECFCQWVYYLHRPAEACWEAGPGRDRDDSGWIEKQRTGKGSGAGIGAQVGFSSNRIEALAASLDRHTLELGCWRITEWDDFDVSSANGPETLTVSLPRLVRCPDTCTGTVETSAVLSHTLDVRVARQIPSLATRSARASGQAELRIHDPLQSDPNPVTWQADVECVAETCESSQGPSQGPSRATSYGKINLPGSGKVVLPNTRRVTATVSGKVEVNLEATEEGQWSYGFAQFRAVRLDADVTAFCALEPVASVAFIHREFEDPDINGECGELEINPWVDE